MKMNKERKRLLLLLGGGWITNMGNAFLDLGLVELINQASQNYQCYVLSNTQRWIFDRVSKLLEFMTRGKKASASIFKLQQFVAADFVAIHGACLGMDWIKLHGEKISALVKRGAKLLIIGGGMTSKAYRDKKDIKETKRFLEKVKPYVLVSRDEITFETFKEFAEYSYNGIDCAFFINDAVKPPHLDCPPYVVFNFDKSKEPNIDTILPDKDVRIVRTHHSYFYSFKTLPSYYTKDNVLISDIPYDYLAIYANTCATYSNRIHACVATVSYGKPARLFTDNPRSFLFERVGLGEITRELAVLDKRRVQEEKRRQIEFLRAILSS